MIDIYTDGSCPKNPGGPGGWAFVICYPPFREPEFVERSGGDPETTNNRMELQAVIEALKALPQGSTVTIHSDSQYVVRGASEWMAGWKAKGWRKLKKNVDLWQEIDRLAALHTVHWTWVRGHNGDYLNERCDYLAGKQAEAMGASL